MREKQFPMPSSHAAWSRTTATFGASYYWVAQPGNWSRTRFLRWAYRCVGDPFLCSCGARATRPCPIPNHTCDFRMVDSAYEALRDGLPDEDRATPVLCLRGEGTRLFGTSRDANRLGDYLRQMRHRLDDLVVWGQHHDSTRQKLYRHRTLLAQSQAIVARAADDERTCTEDQIFDQLLSPAAGLRISILGDAGSGKTTLLDQIAWRFANRLLGTPDAQPRRFLFESSSRTGTIPVPGPWRICFAAAPKASIETSSPRYCAKAQRSCCSMAWMKYPARIESDLSAGWTNRSRRTRYVTAALFSPVAHGRRIACPFVLSARTHSP